MKYFLIAGEASGDLHASNLMAELKQQDHKAEFCFLGGDLMQAQGGQLIKHYRDMAFMGFINVLLNLQKVLTNFKECKRAIADFKPDVVILIDYPSFNLRMAKYVKKQFKIPVFYYISPKLWAWKTFRIKSIKKYIDKMYTIFPFETEFYAQYNYPVTYVGNPTVDSIAQFHANKNSQNFREENNLDERPIVALLAGSRRQEIRKCLPIMVAMADLFSNFQFLVAAAPGIEQNYYNQFLTSSVKIVSDSTYALLDTSYAAIVNSGTATLETGLLKVPQIVVYYVAGERIASLLKNIFIKTRYISLVNLIAQKEVVKELIAHEFTPERVYKELNKILTDSAYYEQIKAGYDDIEKQLGKSGTAHRAAVAITASLSK
ncbi:MAG TPA: lipid-A-disaccharide synthase [Paludibacteraceae bacterium]|jgi:lipid-A-disaccharide synthase|nr:lipid-A-disaccharide synthase [Paludibacteraceae bacterium]